MPTAARCLATNSYASAVCGLTLLLMGCAGYQPTAEEADTRSKEFVEYCDDMQKAITREGDFERKSALQDRYYLQCLAQDNPRGSHQ